MRLLGYLGWLLRLLLRYPGRLLGCILAVAKVPGQLLGSSHLLFIKHF